MRGVGVVTTAVVAVALVAGCSELLAKTQTPMVVHSMSVRPDLVQLQAATLEWLRASITSSTFIAGTVIGVVFAEIGRFILRWLLRALGLAKAFGSLVMRYRLLVVGALVGIYYVIAHHVIG